MKPAPSSRSFRSLFTISQRKNRRSRPVKTSLHFFKPQAEVLESRDMPGDTLGGFFLTALASIPQR